MRLRYFTLVWGIVLALARPAAADAAVTVMEGSESLVAFTFLLDAHGRDAGKLLFVLHGVGRSVSPAGVSEGAWYEAVLGGTTAWPPPTFRGPLNASDVSIALGGGGRVRFPLGAFGEANLKVSDLGADSFPVGCTSMSVSSYRISFESATGQMWSWSATTYHAGPHSADVSGTAAGFRVTARPPGAPDFGPLATLSERGVARIYETPTLPAGPVFVGVTVGCV